MARAKPCTAMKCAQALAETEQALRGRGRVVLRASGTEPLVRVTVEGADAAEVRQLAGEAGRDRKIRRRTLVSL